MQTQFIFTGKPANDTADALNSGTGKRNDVAILMPAEVVEEKLLEAKK